MSEHLTFTEESNPGKKTQRWVVTNRTNVVLGHVMFWQSWRRYVFTPLQEYFVFDAECLRGLADFCEEKTVEHKEQGMIRRELQLNVRLDKQAIDLFMQSNRHRYNDWTDNQGIHCNRFPSWEELTIVQRLQWIKDHPA